MVICELLGLLVETQTSLTNVRSLLGDSLNTTVTVIATLQNEVVAYNTLTLTYLFLVGIAAQLVGIGGFWLIQKKWKLSTKTMFDWIMIGILVLDGWGMIGSKSCTTSLLQAR